MSSEHSNPNTASCPSSQTSAHIFWHTSELLTMVLSRLTKPRSEDYGRWWRSDVLTVLTTSKYGLDVGAGVMYASEDNFSEEIARDGLMGLVNYLERAGCPQSRIKMYCSKVQRLDAQHYGLEKQQIAVSELAKSLDAITNVFPLLNYISTEVNGTPVAFVRDTASNRYVSMAVTAYVNHKDKCEGCIPTFFKAISAQPINACGTPCPITSLQVDRRFIDLLKSVKDLSVCLDLPRSASSFADLTTYISGMPVVHPWTVAKCLLDSTPRLSSLDIELQETSAENAISTAFPEGTVYDNVRVANVRVHRGDAAENLHTCMTLFPRLRDLTVTFGNSMTFGDVELDRPVRYSGLDRQDPPRTHPAIGRPKLYRLERLTLNGDAMRHNLAMDLLEYCSHVTHLHISASPMSHGREQRILRDLAETSPEGVQSLTIAYGSVAFPIIPHVDELVRRLPNLQNLAVRVRFPNKSMEEVADWSENALEIPEPRWPSIRKFDLSFFGDYQVDGEEETIMQSHPASATMMLSYCLPLDAVVRGRAEYDFDFDMVEEIGERELGHFGAGWWSVVENTLKEVREEYEEMAEKHHPGWSMVAA